MGRDVSPPEASGTGRHAAEPARCRSPNAARPYPGITSAPTLASHDRSAPFKRRSGRRLFDLRCPVVRALSHHGPGPARAGGILVHGIEHAWRNGVCWDRWIRSQRDCRSPTDRACTRNSAAARARCHGVSRTDARSARCGLVAGGGAGADGAMCNCGWVAFVAATHDVVVAAPNALAQQPTPVWPLDKHFRTK